MELLHVEGSNQISGYFRGFWEVLIDKFLTILELFGQDRRDFVFLKVFKKSSNLIGS